MFQVVGLDATGIQLNLTTAQQLSLAIAGTNALNINSNRQVSIPAPASGIALTVTGSGAAAAIQISAGAAGTIGGFDSTAASGTYFSITVNGAPIMDIGSRKQTSGGGSSSDGGVNVRGANTFALSTNTTERITVSGSGAVVINAPTAGQLPLGVFGTSATDIIECSSTGAAGLFRIGWNTALTANAWNILGNSTDDITFGSVGAANIRIASAAAYALQVTSLTEVGIATPATIGNLGAGMTQAGYMDTPTNSQNGGNYTLALTDRGKVVFGGNAHTVTIPANGSIAFPIGTTILILNTGGGAISIAITTDTLNWLPSGAAGTRTLANLSIATLLKVNATTWYIWGIGLS